MTASATGRRVLITGTSTGIGLAASLELARHGWRVIATMRNPDRGAALLALARDEGLQIEVRRLDVTSDESVATCLASVVADFGGLDAVVNNAGAGHVGTLEREPLSTFAAVVDTNLIGVARVTKAVLPLLRESGGQVLTVSSVGGVVGQPFNEAYCAAKFGVEGLLESLAPVARAIGVRVTIVEPGAVASEFVSTAVTNIEETGAGAGDYAPALHNYLERTRGAFASAQEPSEVAAVIRAVLDSPDPAFRTQTSDAARTFVSLKLADSTGRDVQAVTSAWVT